MVYATTPEGKIIEYPTARYIQWGETVNRVFTGKDGDFVAGIPTGWALSFQCPKQSNDTPQLTLSAALLIVAGHLREYKGGRWSKEFGLLKQIKGELVGFDARSDGWKR